MAARKSADSEGVRKNIAVFAKAPRNGGNSFVYIRQPFNIVQFDWGNGEYATYFELCLGNRFRSYAGDATEKYDDMRVMEFGDMSRWPRIDRADI